MKIIDKIKKFYYYSQIMIFNNRIGYFRNIIHITYYILIRIRFLIVKGNKKMKAEVSDQSRFLREEGYCIISNTNQQVVSKVREKVERCFQDENLCVRSLQNRGLVRLRDSFSNIPELEEFIISADQYIREYYGTDYKIFSTDVYRTTQKQVDEEAFDSEKFHLDNGPRSTLKIMVYLTDVTKDTGAITVIPKKRSRSLVMRGFWDRFRAQKYKNELEENSIVLEGASGTIILFTPQFCIHKATLPESSYRDVAVFLVYPYHKEYKITSAFRKQCSNYYGYLKNPYSWKPLRVGDE